MIDHPRHIGAARQAGLRVDRACRRGADRVEKGTNVTEKKMPRYSISVSGEIYDRLRSVVVQGSVAAFVDDIVLGALDDPAITARLVAQCQRKVPREA